MKEIIANAPSALYFAQPQLIINNNKKGCLLGHPRRSKKLQKSFEILDTKRSNNWPMMSFIHSFIHSFIRIEIRNQRVSSDNNKLDGIDSYNQPQNCEIRTPCPLVQFWLQVWLLIPGHHCLAQLFQTGHSIESGGGEILGTFELAKHFFRIFL